MGCKIDVDIKLIVRGNMENLFKNMKRIIILWYISFVLIILIYPVIILAQILAGSESVVLSFIAATLFSMFFLGSVICGVMLVRLYVKVSKELTEYIFESSEFENKKIGYLTMRYAIYRPKYHRLFKSKTEADFKENLGSITTRIKIEECEENE